MIRGKINVRELPSGKLYTFDTIAELESLIFKSPQISLIEVFSGGDPFRAHFDLDLKVSDVPHEDAKSVIGGLKNCFIYLLEERIKELLGLMYDIDDMSFYTIVYDNSDDEKISLHIIFPHIIFPDAYTFKRYGTCIAEDTNADYRNLYGIAVDVIDFNLINNLKTKSLRVPLTSKYDADTRKYMRQKKLANGYVPIDFGGSKSHYC